jgi:hypothetical protein
MNIKINNIKIKSVIIPAILGLMLFTSCEKEIDIDMPAYTPSVVIEGFIVNGMNPVVALTNNVDYVSLAGKDLYEQSFIHNALVVINKENNGGDTLEEKINTDPKTGMTTAIYTTNKIVGEVGKSYTLTITTGGKTYSAVAKIPTPVKIQDIWYEAHPDATNDSLKTVWVKILDPDEANYYRYTSEVNGEFQPSAINLSTEKNTQKQLIVDWIMRNRTCTEVFQVILKPVIQSR